MTSPAKVVENAFFHAASGDRPGAHALAEALIEDAAELPAGVSLVLADGPFTVALDEFDSDRLLAALGLAGLEVARAVLDLVRLLGAEVRPDQYFLDELCETAAALPPLASLDSAALDGLLALHRRGCCFEGLPADPEQARAALVRLSQELGISLEYLLGSAGKVVALAEVLGVRAASVNLSALYHNQRSGFGELEFDPAAPAPTPAVLLDQAAMLAGLGVEVRLFRGGRFDAALADLDAAELAELAAAAEVAYGAPDGEFLRFAGAALAAERARLDGAPALRLRAVLACFKFSAEERERVGGPTLVADDDPRRWHESELGRALVALRPAMNWLAASTGIKAAGELDQLAADAGVGKALARLRELATGRTLVIASGRGDQREECDLSALDDHALRFDLYCLAVLEKRAFGEVVATAVAIAELIERIEHGGSLVALDALVSARLAGESYATLLGTQGLVLREAPISAALGALRGLGETPLLTVTGAGGRVLPVARASSEEFRRAAVMMGRRLGRSPERILAAITDRIVPEIRHLPAQVIAPGGHSLEHIVELALAGIPARYPLRRPWQRVNLDPMVTLGSGLEPGIRNCLGCPVNALYGLVMKSAIASGFDEIITYEATGCFEVYSGIWPYTGKCFPSVHGVFGGAPSEMLGGLAAKRARASYAQRRGQPLPSRKTLHLGWGGDGGTFDIGFGNLSGLYSRLQHLEPDALDTALGQRALYVCYDNEGYQNTGNQYSAATAPGGNTTTNPRGAEHPIGNDLRKKPIVEIVAEHGVPLAARANIHRQEHITRLAARALADGDRGSFLHFLQPCTTGWKFTSDSLTYDLAHLAEDGALFVPVTIEHGIPYLEIYPTPRDPGQSFLALQARFRHLLGAGAGSRAQLERVMDYYRAEWQRNLRLTGFEGEIPQADRFAYLEDEHRYPRVS